MIWLLIIILLWWLGIVSLWHIIVPLGVLYLRHLYAQCWHYHPHGSASEVFHFILHCPLSWTWSECHHCYVSRAEEQEDEPSRFSSVFCFTEMLVICCKSCWCFSNYELRKMLELCSLKIFWITLSEFVHFNQILLLYCNLNSLLYVVKVLDYEIVQHGWHGIQECFSILNFNSLN